MMENVPVINKTMELSDCKEKWIFDEKYECWCLEDILYTEKAKVPKFQRLSIFVPKPYMNENGEINRSGKMNGYTAENVPVIFENNSAGYMQMPHVWLDGPRCYAKQYLDYGFVYITCGSRGSESRDENGQLCGKSPANLVDLETAIRFLRHNAADIPGDLNHIVSVGWSAGGAMSALLAVTGNNEDYIPYLKENGAFMEESDSVFAAQAYCPIVDLEHADLAYEWMFCADKENEASPAGPAGVMTPFEEALSEKLKEKYIRYFNGLKLRDPKTGKDLVIGEDGRSGSGYDYLMEKLDESASVYLKKLDNHETEEGCTAADYLMGNYEYETAVPVDRNGKKNEEEKGDPPSLGDLVSRPPEGVKYREFGPKMVMAKGKPKQEWLKWDGVKAHICSLDSYVQNHRRRMKPCTSFDTLGMDSGENRVFGSPEDHFMHFNQDIADAVLSLKEEFPEEYELYYEAYEKAKHDSGLKRRVYLLNPLNYIGREESSSQAEYYRIRVGTMDADTSLTVSMTLALKLMGAGKKVDYELVWDKPHCEADYPGEICRWIGEITGRRNADGKESV